MTSRSYEFRPLTILELIDQGFHIYRSHFQTFFMIAVIPCALFGLIQGYITALLIGPIDPDSFPMTWAMMAHVAIIVGGLLAAVGQWVAGAALTWSVAESSVGRPVSISASYSSLVNRAWSLGSLVIRLVLLHLLGLFGCYFGVMIAFAFTSLSNATLCIERVSPDHSLDRSFAMVKSDFGRATKLFALLGVLFVVAVVGMGSPVSLIQFGHSAELVFLPLSVAGQVVFSLAAAMFAPFATAVITLYYFDLRVRNEDFNRAQLVEALSGQGSDRVDTDGKSMANAFIGDRRRTW